MIVGRAQEGYCYCGLYVARVRMWILKYSLTSESSRLMEFFVTLHSLKNIVDRKLLHQ